MFVDSVGNFQMVSTNMATDESISKYLVFIDLIIFNKIVIIIRSQGNP